MIKYSIESTNILNEGYVPIYSFIDEHERNIDWTTVNSFSHEWTKFNDFDELEIQQVGDDYFDLIDESIVNGNTLSLDVGCGSGRWARYLSEKIGFVEAIDPSESVYHAASYLQDKKNVRVSQASVEKIPFDDETFDFVYSLGVFHHLPDASSAISNCRQKLKSGGWFLLYLYYALENRGSLYHFIFKISILFRFVISRLPSVPKQVICDLIAFTIYLPASLFARALYIVPGIRNFIKGIPLSYYRKTSFQIMRNDALDRFGTPLEKRFTREDIENMLVQNNFINIKFSKNPPYWHVIAQRPQ